MFCKDPSIGGGLLESCLLLNLKDCRREPLLDFLALFAHLPQETSENENPVKVKVKVRISPSWKTEVTKFIRDAFH